MTLRIVFFEYIVVEFQRQGAFPLSCLMRRLTKTNRGNNAKSETMPFSYLHERASIAKYSERKNLIYATVFVCVSF